MSLYRDSTVPAKELRKFFQGEFVVALSALSLSLGLLTFLLFFLLLILQALPFFSFLPFTLFELKDGRKILGAVIRQLEKEGGEKEFFLYTGNRDLYGRSYLYLSSREISRMENPGRVVRVERLEYGEFIGFISPDQYKFWKEHREEIQRLEKQEKILSKKALLLSKKWEEAEKDPELYERIGKEEEKISQEMNEIIERKESLKVVFLDGEGKGVTFPLYQIRRIYFPNEGGFKEKVRFIWNRLFTFFLEEPREANTEGGIYPAIVGTILMVFLMTIAVLPLGVIVALYLSEYAREGLLKRWIRMGVQNMAGVPSIVYGIFGLGFFVYGVGGTIDRIFFSDRLPQPTFGTGGILWSSLTLALLTLPVVIVATEEGIRSVPPSLREGAYALGATKWELISRVILPSSLPGILTGMILAISRAAGEVAPLMITGVVKLAPELPIDGTFPFLHLERKFMHVGFHIYDLALQSPDVEATKPMAYLTILVLLFLVILLNGVGIYMRNRIRNRLRFSTF
jgi:phosphate transport system permease protein